jgi:uncharacterized alpha/beta hydrolase family protein
MFKYIAAIFVHMKKSSHKKKGKSKKVASSKFKFLRNWKFLLLIIIILIVLISFQVGIRINFLTKNELFIEINPQQKIIETDYDKEVPINFSIKNHNFWFCKTTCELNLIDPYHEKSLFSENITLNANSKIDKNFKIFLNTKGNGGRIYYFEAECNNIKSSLCQTNEEKVLKTSFISINYKLPESELNLSNRLKIKLNDFSDNLNYANNLVEEINLIVLRINETKVIELDFENNINNFYLYLKKIEKLWVNEDYKEINDIFTEREFNDLLDQISYLENFKNNLLGNIESYNLNVKLFNSFKLNWNKFNEAYKFYLSKDSLIVKNITGINNRIQISQDFFYRLNFNDLTILDRPILNLNSSFFESLKKFYVDKGKFEENSLDIIGEHLKIQSLFEVQNITLEITCDNLKKVEQNYQTINNQAEINIDKYETYLNNTEFLNEIILIKESIIKGNFDEIIVNNSLNLSKEDYASTIKFEYDDLVNVSSIVCYSINQSLIFNNYSFGLINLSTYSQNLSFGLEFNENPSKCCIYGSCSECLVNESLYPIIFIHGHSPIEDNPIEGSLATFSKIQKKMSEERLFINVGDIDISEISIDEKWSEMMYPITVKASYYYTYYYDLSIYSAIVRNSDSIESYAIRLKELIDIVKLKTGAKKVNLVSHSMGGLVAREYMALFGENNVDKLIMIGTPNHGISGKTKTFCSKLGSDKECLDMYEGSIFLKKLNNNIPKNVKVFIFYGTGCNTDDEDGDGTSQADSVILDYADNFEVKGQCDGLFGQGLHSDMLDPGKYIEVYDKIVKILES